MQTTTQTNISVRSQRCITATGITALSLFLSLHTPPSLSLSSLTLFPLPPFLPSFFQIHFNFSCSWKSHASKIAPTIKYVGFIMARTVASDENQQSIIATRIKITILKKKKRLEACQLWMLNALNAFRERNNKTGMEFVKGIHVYYYYYFTHSCFCHNSVD